MNALAAETTLAYCPFGSSPFAEACGRPHPEDGPQGAIRPAEPPDETLGDLVRLLARSRPSFRRVDRCLWSK